MLLLRLSLSLSLLSLLLSWRLRVSFAAPASSFRGSAESSRRRPPWSTSACRGGEALVFPPFGLSALPFPLPFFLPLPFLPFLPSLSLPLSDELESESESDESDEEEDDEEESLSLDDDESELDDESEDDESELDEDDELLEEDDDVLGGGRFFLPFLGASTVSSRSCHSRCGSGG